MSSVSKRLSQVASAIGAKKSPNEVPWDPDHTDFPTRKNLPPIPGAPDEAAWFWGKEDYVRNHITFACPTQPLLSDFLTGRIRSEG
jgi:hypothetical protein